MSFKGSMTTFKNRYRRAYDLFGRDIVRDWGLLYLHRKCEPRVLDVGCGQGDDLIRIVKDIPDVSAYGFELQRETNKYLRQHGIDIQALNLESHKFPFKADFFDLVLANQVFEHLKNWVWVLMQIGIVLKKGGRLIIGIPNLASFHNRILLLMGQQPSCIHVGGMHIRGFTYPGIKEVIEYKNIYRIIDVKGSAFYPFPPTISNCLSKLFPKASASIFILCEKTGDPMDYNTLEAIARREELSLQNINME
jgi:SAM-dependent methyltransferase